MSERVIEELRRLVKMNRCSVYFEDGSGRWQIVSGPVSEIAKTVDEQLPDKSFIRVPTAWRDRYFPTLDLGPVDLPK